MNLRTLRALRCRAAHLAMENRRLKEEVARLSEWGAGEADPWTKLRAKQLLAILGVL